MNYINAGKLRSFLENVPSNSYVAVGTRENSDLILVILTKYILSYIQINMMEVGV